jgi:uncharacterized protein YidB (DUF937 family)
LKFENDDGETFHLQHRICGADGRKIMALFDSTVEETGEKFDLTADQVKALLSALLGLMTDSATGGFSGLIRRFRGEDSSETSSLQTFSDDAPFSKELIESSLDAETIAALADRAGLDYATTVSALTFLLPQTVHLLTPNGKIPDDQTLRAAAQDLTDDSNASALTGSATSAASTEAFDRIGNATEDIAGKEHDMMSDDRIDDPAAVVDRFSAAAGAASDQRPAENYQDEFSDDSPLKWLAPLIILALLVGGGFWFCGKSSSAPHAAVNADPDFSIARADAQI